MISEEELSIATGIIHHGHFLKILEFSPSKDDIHNATIITTDNQYTSQEFSLWYLQAKNSIVVTKATHPEYYL